MHSFTSGCALITFPGTTISNNTSSSWTGDDASTQFLQYSSNYDDVVPSEGADVGERGNSTSYAWVEVLKSGEGVARVEQLSTQPHVEFLAQHVRGELEGAWRG